MTLIRERFIHIDVLRRQMYAEAMAAWFEDGHPGWEIETEQLDGAPNAMPRWDNFSAAFGTPHT